MVEAIAPLKLPKSCVYWTDPILIAVLIVGVYSLLWAAPLSNLHLVMVLVGSVFCVMLPIEYLRSPSRHLQRPQIPFKEIAKASLLKLLGGTVALMLVVAAWAVVPEYALNEYIPFIQSMDEVLPFYFMAMAACILFTEWRLGPEKDALWQFGQIARGSFQEVDWSVVRLGLFSLLVKGFWLPLNVSGASNILKNFRGKEELLLTSSWPQTIAMLDHIIFAALLIAIIPGYMFESRLLGTRTKKVEQSCLGWSVTLLCYPPINRGAGNGWFTYYAGGIVWPLFFGASGAMSITVGCALLLFYLVHYWGEASCCLRSSHLTSRGVITGGPFRLCKHPVYVSKSFAWALAFLPFFNGKSLLGDIRNGLAFFAFCGVYVMRGWVEERLMSSSDKTYIAYALWMEKNSIFRCVGKHIPFFSYVWRLERWRKAGIVPSASVGSTD